MVWEQNGSRRPLDLTQGTRHALEIRSERAGNERGAATRPGPPAPRGLALRRLQPREVGGRAQLEQVWNQRTLGFWARPYLAADA